MIRVVLVDDQELVRSGLRALAERDGDIEIVAEGATGRVGLERTRAHRPDVVLMDIRMPEMDGLEATREIVGDSGLAAVRVVVLTTFDEDEHVFASIRAGAAGYLLKDIAPDELRRAIRIAAAGDALLSPQVTARVMRAAAGGAADPAPVSGLTPREREFLALVGRGLTNAEIAQRLFLSPATARTYVSRLLAKLQARDRAALIVLAYESGLVRPGE